MKKYLLFIISFLFTVSHLSSSESIKMGIISDIHYLSSNLMDGKYAIQNAVDKSGRNFIACPEVLDQVIADYIVNPIDILLISGDLTKDGEKESHLELREKLHPLLIQGTKIFVIPGNHDINMPNSIGYLGNQTYKTDNVSPTNFTEIYKEYGYGNAISRDHSSLSYVAQLNEKTWLLAIDAARYDEYKTHSITAGRIKPETRRWMEDIFQLAKEEQIQIIAMMHWGVVEHLPMQSSLFRNYLVDDFQLIANFLANNEVKTVFTGHFHSNDISEYKSNEGNIIYDIETGTLSSYPFSYRFVELNKDSINIRTQYITSIESEPNLAINSKERMKKIATKLAQPKLKDMGFQLSKEASEKLYSLAGELFVVHLAGDEIVNDSIKKEFINVFKEMEIPIDEDIDEIELDLSPKDNNLTIYF